MRGPPKKDFFRWCVIATMTCISMASIVPMPKQPSLNDADRIGDTEAETVPQRDHFQQQWVKIESFERENYQRAAQSHRVDYGGNHPYEVLERRRLKNSEGYDFTEAEDEEFHVYHQRNLSPWSVNSVYQSLRIHFDTTFIEIMQDSDKYANEIAIMKNEILPKVKLRWQAALKVYRAQGNVVIDESRCPYSAEDQITTGVPNADLVIYVAANFDLICQAKSALAGARACQADQYDRPIAGSVIVCLDRLDVTSESSKDKFYKTILHEISHVLGMRAIDFPFYYDPETGLPRTPRPFQPKTVTCVDGNMIRTAAPSDTTLKAGFTNRGNLYYEIVTPTVTQVVRNHFDCQKMSGARLENQPTNDGNCFGSHWEARLFASEVVAAIKVPTMQLLTPLTLALFEDSGWYKSDFSVANISPFGHGRGCDFVFEDCIVDGEVPEWGKGVFCNDFQDGFAPQKCDIGHRYITRCDLVDFDDHPQAEAPDRNHQYFPQHPVSRRSSSSMLHIFSRLSNSHIFSLSHTRPGEVYCTRPIIVP